MSDPLLGRTIYELDVSLQVAKVLKDEGIVRIGDLVYLTESELRQRSSISPELMSEVKLALSKRGLSLGTRTDPRTGHPTPNPLLLHVVDELGLDASTLEALKTNDIYYIGDLTQRTEPQLLGELRVPRNRVQEVRKALKARGLDLSND
jgi:DNA-directed RNA polymerase alpha subunit